MLRPVLILLALASLLAACDEFGDMMMEPDGFSALAAPADTAPV